MINWMLAIYFTAMTISAATTVIPDNAVVIQALLTLTYAAMAGHFWRLIYAQRGVK